MAQGAAGLCTLSKICPGAGAINFSLAGYSFIRQLTERTSAPLAAPRLYRRIGRRYQVILVRPEAAALVTKVLTLSTYVDYWRRSFMHIVLLGAFFGFLLFVATNSVSVLAAESPMALAWWGSLFPLAYSHGMAGFLAMRRDLRGLGRWRAGLISATISAATTALSMALTGWLAFKVGPLMSQHIALVVLVLSSLAGVFGLALAIRLWPDDARSGATDQHEATSPPEPRIRPLSGGNCRG